MTHLFWRICSLVKMLLIWCEDCVDLFTDCSSHIVWNIAIQILTLMKYKSNDIDYQKGYKVLINDMKYIHWRYECYDFLCNFLGGFKISLSSFSLDLSNLIIYSWQCLVFMCNHKKEKIIRSVWVLSTKSFELVGRELIDAQIVERGRGFFAVLHQCVWYEDV